MDVVTILDELQNQALRDPEVRNRFLDTRQAKEPLTAFAGYAGSWDMKSTRWT